MSDLRNIASRYFDGLPVSNSGEPLVGDAEDFVMKIFPDEILSQVEEPDGSISYLDSKGDVVAVIDADGNVYVNEGGDVIVYEAASDDEPQDDASDVFNGAGNAEGVFGPAKGECVSGDFGAEICEANDSYREDVQQCIPPGPDSQTAMANAAKNLFGGVEDFVDGVLGEDADEGGIEEDEGILDEMGEFLGRVVEEAGDAVEKVVEIVEDAVEYVSKKASGDPSKEVGDKGESGNATDEVTSVEDQAEDDISFDVGGASVGEGNKGGASPSDTPAPMDSGGGASNDADDAGPGGLESANPSYSSYPEVPDSSAADLNGGLIMQELRGSGIADALPDKTKAAAAAIPDVAQPAVSASLLGARRYVHHPQGSSNRYDISSMGAMAAAREGGNRESSDAAHQKLSQSYLTAAGTRGDGLDPSYRREVSRHQGSNAVRASANGLGLLAGISAGDEESNLSAMAEWTKGLGGMACLFANFAGGGIAVAAGNARENSLSVKAPHHHGNPSDQNGERDGKQGRGDDQEGDEGEDEDEVMAIC